MKRRKLTVVAALSLLVAGCDTMKSASPTSPSVAGPIAGVSITAPRLLEPWNGFSVNAEEQPITLLIENASSSGQRALTYWFEVSTTADFANKVFTRGGVAPGEGGRTSLKLPDALASDRTYYWRARADDGANAGPFSGSMNFSVFTPVKLGVPLPLSPVGGVKLPTRNPDFVIANAGRSGPVGQVYYVFEISENSSFTAQIALVTIPEQPNQTRFTLANQVGYDRGYFWRVRAHDMAVTTAWSTVNTFMGPEAPPPPPPPPDLPIPQSGGSNGNWRTCGSTPGDALVRCVHNAINPARTEHGAFEVTKRVAWLLRGQRAGLLIKNGGENIVAWKGYSFAAARICYPDGHIYKILSDVPATNGPSWQDNDYVSPSLYVPAIDPDS
jgi:hypothetical protein